LPPNGNELKLEHPSEPLTQTFQALPNILAQSENIPSTIQGEETPSVPMEIDESTTPKSSSRLLAVAQHSSNEIIQVSQGQSIPPPVPATPSAVSTPFATVTQVLNEDGRIVLKIKRSA
jgi:hypothetical protein